MYLTKPGYKQSFIQEQISRAKLKPRNEALKEHEQAPKDTSDQIPLTITYNPALPNIQDMLCKKQSILHSIERLKNIFKEVPVAAFRRSPNLRDLLVSAKLASTYKTCTFRCNSKQGCLTCPFIENGQTSYTFTNRGETREIRHHVTCNSTNLTYIIVSITKCSIMIGSLHAYLIRNWRVTGFLVVQFGGNRARNFKSSSRCALGRFKIIRPITP